MREEDSLRLLKSKARCDPERAFGDARDDMARALCRLCGYLPLSLVLVGSALGECKELDDWSGYLEDLRGRERADELDPDQVVQRSIERLKARDRACFLDVVLWKEDEEITTEDFMGVWQVRLPQLSDGQVGRMLAAFVSANLLIKTERGYYRVHDVIRAAAIRMSDAEQPRERLAAPGGSFTEWPREWRTAGVLQGCRFLSLRGMCAAQVVAWCSTAAA